MNFSERALERANADPRDLEQTLALLQEGVAAGEPSSMIDLAMWHIHGGTEGILVPSMKEAIKLLRLAAAEKSPVGLINLAIAYETGSGVPTNFRLAFELYVSAALRGDEDAVYEVARCYRFGIGTEKNLRLADVWRERAVELGVI